MKRMMAILLAMAVAAFVGCGEDAPTESSTTTYDYADFVHFDTIDYRYAKRILSDYGGSIPEPVVNWERSMGEPFTDVNGNGVYDAGTDVFVMSLDPNLNQDLNRNGKYDGPNDPWDFGISFDDIDGNGLHRPDPGERFSGYVVRMPYADLNSNGRRDGDLKATYGVFRFSSSRWLESDTAYALVRVDSAVYRFVSDSGLNYDLGLGFSSVMNALILTDSGLDYRVSSATVHLLNSGKLTSEDSAFLPMPPYPNLSDFYRTTILNDTLTIDRRLFTGLVTVRIEGTTEKYVFTFSRPLGLLAFERWKDYSITFGGWEDYRRDVECYFRRLSGSHSLIFPTTR